MAEAHYFVAYDVMDNRRRRRTAKVAYSYALGGQKSALETVLEPRDLDELIHRIGKEIDGKQDRVHVLRVASRAILLGKAAQLKYDKGVILI